MKKCPMCAEDIQDEAKVCRHCGSSIENSQKSIEIEKFIAFFHQKTQNVYSIKSRDDKIGKIIMEKDGSAFNTGLCFVLFLFFIIPGFIYLMTSHGKKFTINLYFDETGTVTRITGNNFASIIQEYQK